MIATAEKFDTHLVRAIREGTSALPGDLARLRGYLGMIGALLEEKARELEPNWEQACAIEAEIATLQALEASVAERAIGVRAGSVDEVRAKLAIWRALVAGGELCELRSASSRLILSVEADLERLSGRAR